MEKVLVNVVDITYVKQLPGIYML